jgi:hypothetical protein
MDAPLSKPICMRARGTAAILALGLALAFWCAARANAAPGDCGQPSSAGNKPVASDALFALAAALDTKTCQRCVCDVDNSGSITAGDALRILRVAVGQPQALTCPACPLASCNDAAPPECGGPCSDGLTCAPEPGTPGTCSCLDPCQASAAPACGGSCAILGDPELVCRFVSETSEGSPTREFCTCLPPSIQACSDAQAPACAGSCPPGTLCGANGGACVCSPLPSQGACGEASAPACAGICAATTICQPDGDGGCACVPFAGQEETCRNEEAPTCGGVCADGEECAINLDFTCDCFSPCELGDAPACNGACLDETRSCIAVVSTVGGSSIEHCSCR